MRHYSAVHNTTYISLSGDTPILVERDRLLSVVSASDMCVSPCTCASILNDKVSMNPIPSVSTTKAASPMFSITTEDGHSLTASGNCKLQIQSSSGPISVSLSNLKPLDKILIPNIFPRNETKAYVGSGRGKVEINTVVASALGMIVGSKIIVHSASKISVLLNADWRVDHLVYYAKALHTKWSIHRDDKGYRVTLVGGKILSVVKAMQLCDVSFIPDVMMNVHYDVQLAFIRGYFMSSGVMNSQRDASYLCYVSKGMLDKFVLILRQMNIMPKIYSGASGAIIELSSKDIHKTANRNHIYRASVVKNVTIMPNIDNIVTIDAENNTYIFGTGFSVSA